MKELYERIIWKNYMKELNDELNLNVLLKGVNEELIGVKE